MIKRGTVIGDTYIVKEPLGEGGSGAVFLVRKSGGTELYTLKAGENKKLLKSAERYRVSIFRDLWIMRRMKSMDIWYWNMWKGFPCKAYWMGEGDSRKRKY